MVSTHIIAFLHVVILCLHAFPATADPLEQISGFTEEAFNECFVKSDVMAARCLDETYLKCMDYTPNDLPCVNNTRLSAVSVIETSIASEADRGGFQAAIESGHQFCRELFKFRGETSAGSRIDHCLFSATRMAVDYLGYELTIIRGDLATDN